jgi:Domain of unknown function (DUF4373)
MQWFKHDTDASTDARIKKLILRYGPAGYAVYFHCLELIAGDINGHHITFELEHDAEIIADNLKIQGNQTKSSVDLVNEIMRYIVELELFESQNDHIFCFKMMKRLDSSMTSNSSMRNKIRELNGSHDGIMIVSCKNRTDKNRIDKIEEPRKRELSLTLGFFKNVKLTETEYAKLLEEKGQALLDRAIERLSYWIEEAGGAKAKKYNHNLTLRRWVFKAVADEPGEKLKRIDDDPALKEFLKLNEERGDA